MIKMVIERQDYHHQKQGAIEVDTVMYIFWSYMTYGSFKA
jgi:hypothetical protein